MTLLASKELIEIIRKLEQKPARELESENLDFKRWDDESCKKMKVMAVCFANGGGGHVVYGVEDKEIGLSNAISSVPDDLDLNEMINKIYDSTDPHITVNFEIIELLPQKRILIMNIPKAGIPCSTSDGWSQIRIGNSCKPLTGQARLDCMSASGNFDYTAQEINADWEALISEHEVDLLKEKLVEAGHQDYLGLSKKEVLQKLGCLKEGSLTNAGLLLVGKESALKKYIPNHEWSFSRMISDVDYDIREDRSTALMSSLNRIVELINANNHINTVKEGLYHFEHRTYPLEALREALLNAFSHRDYGSYGTVIIKNYATELQISNPGRFIGGINLDNILYHDPVARNRLLVEILQKIGLVNRSNLGIRRIFKSFLMEGKDPPIILVEGEIIKLIFRAQNFDFEMAKIISLIEQRGFVVNIDILIALNYLKKKKKINLEILNLLLPLQIQERYAEVVNTLEKSNVIYKENSRSKNYFLSKDFYAGVIEFRNDEFFRKLIIAKLKKQNLSMKEIMGFSGLDRHTANNMLRKMQSEGLVGSIGKGRGSKWSLR